MTPDAAIERIYREEYGRIVASLVRRFGDIDIAEEAAGEALLAAVEKWPVDGVPPNPGGWLTTTAGNRAIDKIRRESHRDTKHQAAYMMHDDTPHEPTGIVEDDRLRLIFTCCHPALAPEARVALTLRLLGGLTVAEIAQAFLVPETTMAQRITRAKKKISGAKIPYRVPSAADLAPRVNGVLAVLYLVFNEGYLSSSADASPIRDELTAEAIRLARILRTMLPSVPEVTGLLALMLLTEARRAVRVAGGELVPLYEQDRGGWDRSLIEEGHELVRECLSTGGRGSTRSWRPSTPCTPTPSPPPTPTGARSPRSTPSCTPWGRHRSSPSTARSPWPSSTAPTSRWRRSTASPWRATTPGTPPAPTCSAGSAAPPSPARRTTRRWRSPTTKPSGRTSAEAGSALGVSAANGRSPRGGERPFGRHRGSAASRPAGGCWRPAEVGRPRVGRGEDLHRRPVRSA